MQLIGGKERLLRTEGDHSMPMSRIVLVYSAAVKSAAKIDVYDYPGNYNPFKKNKGDLLQAKIA